MIVMVVMTMIHYKRDGIYILIRVIIIHILVKHIDLIIGCMIALVSYLLMIDKSSAKAFVSYFPCTFIFLGFQV